MAGVAEARMCDSYISITKFIIQHIDTLPKYGKKNSMYVGPRDVYPTIYVSYTCKLFFFFKKKKQNEKGYRRH